MLQVIMGARPRRGAGLVRHASATGWPSTTSTPARSPAPGAPPGRTPAGPARRVSTELWEAINTTWNRLGRPRTRPGHAPASCSRWVRERAALVSGIADSTMSRDEALAVPGARPSPRARRHDGAAASPPAPSPQARAALVDGAAELRRPEAYLRTNRGLIRDDRGRRVPRPRPAVPALGPLRPVRRRAPARGDRPGDAPDGHSRRGPPAARPDPDQPGVPARPRRHGRPARADAPRPGRRDAARPTPSRRRYFPAGTVTTWVEEYA